MDPGATLFTRFRDHGDVAALGQAFDASAPALLSVAMHLCSDPADAEDVLQETFLTAMSRAGSYDPERPLLPWLVGLLRNLARNHRRSRGQQGACQLPDLPSARELDPSERAQREELIALVRTRVEEFPSPQRQVVLLRLLHGLSATEIAEVLGEPPGRVRVRLTRALHRLRAVLPAGLSLAVISMTASRGLAAVRRAVMHQASSYAPTAAAATTLGGVLIMKKLVVAAVIALACALAWIANPYLPLPDPAAPDHGLPPPLTAAASTTQTSLAPSATTSATGQRSPEIPERGSLRVALHSLTPNLQSGSTPANGKPGQLAPGQAILGAVIQLWPGEQTVAPFVNQLRTVATDANGEAHFDQLAPGRWQVLDAADPAAKALSVIIKHATETQCELTREMAGVVRGRVVDALGQGVRSATIWTSRGTGVSGRDGRVEPIDLRLRRAAISDSRGFFAFPYSHDEATLAASHADHTSSRAQAMPGSHTQTLLMRLGPNPLTIAGTVFAPDGTAARDVLIRIVPAGQDTRRAADSTLQLARLPAFTRTNLAGRFAFHGLVKGTHRVWIATTVPGAVPLWHDATIDSASRLDLELHLKPGSQVYGQIRTSDGERFPASVRLTPYQNYSGHYSVSSTRADGSYYLNYAPARSFSIEVRRWGGEVCAVRHFEDREPGRIRCDIVMTEYATLRGRLVDERDRPLASWTVRSNAGSATVTADGGFRVVARRQQTLTIRAYPPNGAAEPSAEKSHVAFGIPIEFRIADAALPACELAGRVHDARGLPLHHALVAIHRDGVHSAQASVHTDSRGEFRIRKLPAGSYEIHVAAHGLSARKLAAVELRHREVRSLGSLTIPTPARLRIQVAHADGRPWQGQLPHFKLLDAAGNKVSFQRIRQRDGDLLVVATPTREPTTYQVKLSGTDIVAANQRVELQRGSTATLRFAVAISRSRTIAFNYGGEDRFNEQRMMDVELRDASGEPLYTGRITSRYRSPYGYHYWSFEQMLAPGRYLAYGKTLEGRVYRAWFTTSLDLDEPTRVDVPSMH